MLSTTSISNNGRSEALVCPNDSDSTKPEDPAPMISFLNHIKAISELLKDKLLEKDSNAQNWMLVLPTFVAWGSSIVCMLMQMRTGVCEFRTD